MKLPNARLCLDCDEVHDQLQCPACASESFAFIKRWVAAPERGRTPVTNEERIEKAATYRALLEADAEPRLSRRLIKGGVAGLAVLGAAGWLLQKNAGKRKDGGQDSGSGGDPSTGS
jgi:hypothetical protein